MFLNNLSFNAEGGKVAKAKEGDTVRVHYTAKLKGGEVVDTTEEREPWEFKLGEGNVIPGFEEAVVGMNPGESKTVSVPSDKAYGPHRKERILVVERDKFPKNMKPEKGQYLRIPQQDGTTATVTVIEVSESKVTIDGNHPLAGKDLVFDIELVEVK
jgi:peptidylprolyl isomerase